MKKKIISMILVMSMSVGMLAGCGDSSSKTSGVAKTQTTDDKSESKSNDSSSEDREVDSENIDTDDDLVCYTSGVDTAKYEQFLTEKGLTNDHHYTYTTANRIDDLLDDEDRIFYYGESFSYVIYDLRGVLLDKSIESFDDLKNAITDIKNVYENSDEPRRYSETIDFYNTIITGDTLTVGNYLCFYKSFDYDWVDEPVFEVIFAVKGTGLVLRISDRWQTNEVTPEIIEAVLATTKIYEPFGMNADNDPQKAVVDMSSVDCDSILNEYGWDKKMTLTKDDNCSIGINCPNESEYSREGTYSIETDYDFKIVFEHTYSDLYVSKVEDLEYLDDNTSGSYKELLDDIGRKLSYVEETDEFIACVVKAYNRTYIRLYLKDDDYVFCLRIEHEKDLCLPGDLVKAFVHTIRILNVGYDNNDGGM